jgi:FHA domain
MGLPLKTVSGRGRSQWVAQVDLRPYTVGIARGDGLVARFGDVVLYIADATGCADRLLAVSESVSDTERPGGVIAGRLAAIVFGPDSRRITPFGVVMTSVDGLHVILRGPVTAHTEDANSAQTLCGSRALTWVDEVLPGSVHTISVAGSLDSRVSDCPRTDLRSGVVPGGGFVLHRTPGAAPTVRANHVAPQRHWPMGGPTERLTPSHTAPVETSAVSTVGAVLTSQDGAVYPLDRCYVIGRYPLGDDAVRSAAASPIVLHNDNHVSRVHAYVSIDRGTVYVRDASTSGGTFIAAPGAKDWTRIGTAPTRLEPGWSMRVGERILTYHAS